MSRIRRRGAVAAASILALFAVSLVLSSCSSNAGRSAGRVPVVVATAERRAMPHEIVATGTVAPLQTANVGSEVGGTVVGIGFREGAGVRQGQLLFQLDPKPYRAALDQARAVFQRDLAQARNARANADRARTLLAQNLISPEEFQGDTTNAQALDAQARADSAVVENARLDLDYAAIRAPISGRAGRLLVHVGDYVKANSTDPLVTINQIQPILVQFAVPERDLREIQRVRDRRLAVRLVPAAGDSTALDGALTFMDNAVDPTTGTIMLKAEFPNRDGRLWPGEFADVHLVLGVDRQAIVVPAAAITTAQNGSYVYVVNADSTVTSKPVTVTRTEDDLAIVGAGVRPGDRVVTDGQLRLQPGARVAIAPPVSPATSVDP